MANFEGTGIDRYERSPEFTEAVREYVMRRRVRPEVMSALETSIRKNRELGRLLAQ